MCGIAGYSSFGEDFMQEKVVHEDIVKKMGEKIRHRGPDDFRTYVGKHVAFSHTRLAVMDPEKGIQPMTKREDGWEYTIVYNGEIYNTKELRKELEGKGMKFETSGDTEVVLAAYLVYGNKMSEKLNGIYSFVIWNERERCIFFCRDRMGVKPLFYTIKNGYFIFASEIKSLLTHPLVKPVVNTYGLCELFGIGPARVPGSGVYENIYEVLPAHCGTYSDSGFVQWSYWKLKATNVEDSYEDAVEHVRELLTDSIRRQLVSDVPICTLLSGGLDSSVVSAVAAEYMKEKGKVLDTYSFDYMDNQENFCPSNFQPEQDRPYVDKMIKHIQSNHTYLECAYSELFDCLFDAVNAKDLPGMTDVDASLFYFAKQIKRKHTVCLSGECADEIFGGYPWFRAEESYTVDAFPWSRDLSVRTNVLRKEWRELLPIEEYVQAQYERSIQEAVYLPEELVNRKEIFLIGQKKGEEKSRAVKRREREISHLNIFWFMETLLERKDRMTMANGLEVRVPFADHRLVSYLYALPWEYKYHNKEVKSILKDAMKSYLPDEVVYRKKCPYPKTYDPKFEQLLKKRLGEILADTQSPIRELLDIPYLQNLIKLKSDYGKPWFGQLMATPQMYAYLIQLDYWMKTYHIELHL